MATAISAKSAAPAGKLKRPAPSLVQTGANGVKHPHPSPSPLNSMTRAGVANQAIPSPTMVPTVANGLSGRLMARARKDFQRPSDPSSRLRITTRAGTIDAINGDRRSATRIPEPFVKTSSYILKKFANYPPSFTIHLHPTHFRFEQQDGSFPYNSEMKAIIEHIKNGTVPHDMMEELLKGGVRFYEGCLIVRVVDHKSLSNHPNSSKQSSKEKSSLFSIHNYNEHITPSPYVPFQSQKGQTKTNGVQPSSCQSVVALNKEKDANSKPSLETNGNAVKPKVFTTVLHPTPQSLHAELTVLSITPDPRALPRRQSQAYSVPRPPNSAPLPSPSTPLTSNQLLQADRGPPAKRQKMMVEPHEMLDFEAKMIRATAPPLYLSPVDSFGDSQKLLKFLESPLHCSKPPSPKTRRRTVAELAADEALAAEEERFMLIMDERLEPIASAAAGGSKAAVDEECGAAPFEPRLSRFKTLENIRSQLEEKNKREHERKLQQDRAKREQQEAERERRRSEFRLAEDSARDERRKQLAAQQGQPQTQAHFIAAQQNRRPPSQGNPTAVAVAQPPHIASVSQGPQSSPIVRNITPHTSSPLVGHGMVPNMNQGISISMTSSAEAAGSPLAVSASMQSTHSNAVSHQMVPSRSQQAHSAHGTPQMTQGTPAVSHATPIMRNITPTQRMSHNSPHTTTMAQTPVMGHAMMAPQMNTMMMTTQQQHAMMQQRQAMLAQQQQNIATNHQYSPQQMAQMHANALAQQSIQQ
ncbi:hypothetical protein LOY97_004970, partial [Ophidiomyces ophidiicola]